VFYLPFRTEKQHTKHAVNGMLTAGVSANKRPFREPANSRNGQECRISEYALAIAKTCFLIYISKQTIQ
jgi:hypothetical protein